MRERSATIYSPEPKLRVPSMYLGSGMPVGITRAFQGSSHDLTRGSGSGGLGKSHGSGREAI